MTTRRKHDQPYSKTMEGRERRRTRRAVWSVKHAFIFI